MPLAFSLNVRWQSLQPKQPTIDLICHLSYGKFWDRQWFWQHKTPKLQGRSCMQAGGWKVWRFSYTLMTFTPWLINETDEQHKDAAILSHRWRGFLGEKKNVSFNFRHDRKSLKCREDTDRAGSLERFRAKRSNNIIIKKWKGVAPPLWWNCGNEGSKKKKDGVEHRLCLCAFDKEKLSLGSAGLDSCWGWWALCGSQQTRGWHYIGNEVRS